MTPPHGAEKPAAESAIWIGVDVGGARKRFDVAVIDGDSLLELHRARGCAEVAALADALRPSIVGIDSPRGCAAPGATARAGELALARAVCGIRWTPDRATVLGNPYYAWVVEGLRLFSALAAIEVPTVEVFPTASWTRWLGPRKGETRAAWSRRGLRTLPLAGLPARTSQDARDAIAAALTARQHSEGATECFGEIAVPRSALDTVRRDGAARPTGSGADGAAGPAGQRGRRRSGAGGAAGPAVQRGRVQRSCPARS